MGVLFSMPGLQMMWGRVGGRMGENMEQIFYNLNLRTVILQGERYLKKRKKK